MQNWLERVHVGDCVALMTAMKEAGVRVNCIVTSPPYWGLRDYGTPGQYGLEESFAEHIEKMTKVFDLARELLADDGTLWLNYGDSYATGTATSRKASASSTHGYWAKENGSMRRVAAKWLAPKNLIGMPWRIAFALQEAGWYLRSDIIWHKPSPMPESVTDRPTKSHEYLFLFAKSERYYYDLEAIAEPASAESHARAARGRSNDHKWADGGPGNQTIARGAPVAGWAEGAGSHAAKDHARAGAGSATGKKFGRAGGAKQDAGQQISGGDRMTGFNDRGRTKQNESFSAAVVDVVAVRNARTVWTIPSEPFSGAHFATFPRDLVRRCVLAGSRPGDVVFDPFMGSGTVAQVADELGRAWIGCEINPEYAAMYGTLRARQRGMPF